MMTREEAVELLCYGDWLNVISKHIGETDTERIAEAMSIVGKSLRPVSREQVERMRYPWERIVDAYGNTEGFLCECGHMDNSASNFCRYCGQPKTDEAVQMVMERLEALHGET